MFKLTAKVSRLFIFGGEFYEVRKILHIHKIVTMLVWLRSMDLTFDFVAGIATLNSIFWGDHPQMFLIFHDCLTTQIFNSITILTITKLNRIDLLSFGIYAWINANTILNIYIDTAMLIWSLYENFAVQFHC